MGPLATCLTEEVCIQHCVSATHCSLSPLSNRPSVKQSSTFSDMTLKSSSHEMLEASDAASEAARPAGFRALATSGHQERVPTKSARTPEAPSKSSQRGSSSVESLAKLGSCGAAIGVLMCMELAETTPGNRKINAARVHLIVSYSITVHMHVSVSFFLFSPWNTGQRTVNSQGFLPCLRIGYSKPQRRCLAVVITIIKFVFEMAAKLEELNVMHALQGTGTLR